MGDEKTKADFVVNRRSFMATTIASLSFTPSVFAGERALINIPSEEQKHDGCFMQWPVSVEVYGTRLLTEVQEVIARLANHISESEPVFIAAAREYHGSLREKLGQNVEIWEIATDDLWARDSGPLFGFQNGKAVVSGFNFNAWGMKQPYQNDGKIAMRVAELLGLDYVPADLVGEAGGIEWDGESVLMAHESSWVNPNRNALSRDEIERRLLRYYGARSMIWAPGIYGEDITDYHIDALARFVAPKEVIIQLPENYGDDDPWFTKSQLLYDALLERNFKIHRLPTPVSPRVKGDDFVAAYVNYYLANGVIFLSEFGDSEVDAEAASILAEIYSDREIVMLNTDALGKNGGGIHCATQQIPLGIL